MSHFVTLVLSAEGGEGEIEALLEPYDEGREVPAYERTCWCVGVTAEQEGRTSADAKYASVKEEIEALREPADDVIDRIVKACNGEIDAIQLWGIDVASIPAAVRRIVGDRPGLDELEEEAKRIGRAMDAAIERYERLVEREIVAHPLYRRPMPNCDECHGSGRVETTANPEGYWDWWVIGGRWEGMLEPAHDPNLDIRKHVPCASCEGSGKRRVAAVRQGEAEQREAAVALAGSGEEDAAERACDDCEGTGVDPRLQDVDAGGNRAAAGIVAGLIESGELPIPYALLTRDGVWHAKGQMGWFGMSKDDYSEEEWIGRVVELLRADPTATATVVDCHT